MNSPSYKSLSLFKLKEFTDITEEYTFGEILYSILRKVNKPTEVSNHWMTQVTDEEYYQAIEKAVKEEKA